MSGYSRENFCHRYLIPVEPIVNARIGYCSVSAIVASPALAAVIIILIKYLFSLPTNSRSAFLNYPIPAAHFAWTGIVPPLIRRGLSISPYRWT